MRLLRIWRARHEVVLAAKCVESGYEPTLAVHKADPDDILDLVEAVKALRRAEE